jgi:hypothetical protein
VPKRYEAVQIAEQTGVTSSRLFLTRPKGEKAYKLLKKNLLDVPDGEALVLVFPPNQLIDGSFADEAIVKLGEEILEGEFGDRCMLLEGLTKDSIKNINAVISLNKLKLPLLAVERSGGWQVIGRLEDHLLETLGLLAKHQRLTANDLMTMLNLAVNTASTRLKRLHNLHLVRREYEISEKGLQYIYYFWKWDERAG